MAIHIRRREFIFTLGGAAAAWPLAARAQQAGMGPRIGYLGTSTLTLERQVLDEFRRKLRELGHVEGENIAIEYRWAEGHDERLANLAAELVRIKPDVIMTTGSPGTFAAKQATDTIPIIFIGSSIPAERGFVAGHSRPGGNITGFTSPGADWEGKRLELLKETVSGLSRVAMLWNAMHAANISGWAAYYERVRGAATTLGLTVPVAAGIRQADDLNKALSMIASEHPQAMFVLGDRQLLAHRMPIVQFAAMNRLPTMYPYRQYVDAGGLMSYAPSDIDMIRRAAVYVDKILKGARPADLPVEEPVKFELVINLKAAEAIGFEVPPTLLTRADEVIE
jgi:putative tryptophan/tyrosine transport system substrate-binding protein